jgi:hypothetical protein
VTDTPSSAAALREVVGVFHQQNEFQAAVDELLAQHFDRSELSLLAGDQAIQEKLGHMYEKVAELEDNLQAPRSAYVEKDSVVEARAGTIGGLAYVGAMAAVGGIVASGGALGWAIVGALVFGGGGGALGAWLARRIGKDRAKSVEEQLAKGGLLLWVRARNAEREQLAVDILKRNAAMDVHVHELPGGMDPERDPFSGMEPDPFLPNARV